VRAGNLDRRIVIQSATTAQDQYGEPIETWSTYATLWAERNDLRGTEFFAARQIANQIVTAFRVRWRTDIDPRMKVVDGATTFDIDSIIEYRGPERVRKNGIELMCRASV
jgi:SPP1 family predicted phage head-tail adaptor